MVVALVVATALAAGTEVVVEVGATETPAVRILGGKHIITALRMFGPFFSS